MSLDLGPCAVFFGTEDSEEDLGKTQGGVKVTFSQAVADLLSDQYGTEPEDQVITGHGAVITIPMADYTLANFAIALHKSVLDLGDDSGIKGDSVVGTKLSTYANSLILKKYVDGLCDNHIRKTKDFHCGQAYKIKNPGSRSGNSDPQIKALKALLTQTSDTDQTAQITQAITDRQAQITVEKVKSVVIDVDALPDHLKAFVKS